MNGGGRLDISIKYDNSKPMYEQIEDKIKEEIYLNHAEDNEALPSVRQLSANLNVSAITVKRAYSDLERDGFIYTISGKGTFVKLSNIDTLKKDRTDELEESFKTLVGDMKKAGISHERIKEILRELED